MAQIYAALVCPDPFYLYVPMIHRNPASQKKERFGL